MNKRTYLLIFGVMLFILIVALGYSTLQIVAGPLYAPPPPAPGTPTGSRPTRPPTFDPRQLGLPPTMATSVPAPLESIPTLSRPKPVTPASTWQTYRDPKFGFSFQYPANWKVDAPTGPSSSNTPVGTDIIVRNFEYTDYKGPMPSDLLKIEITLLPELDQYGTLDNWVSRRPLFAPETTFGSRETVSVNGIRALRWAAKGPTVAEGASVVAMGKGTWVYFFVAFPATSTHIATFDRLVSSFQVP